MDQNNAENVQTIENAAIDRRPTIEEMKAADPSIFVRMPGLEAIVLREQKFSETFASVEEAQQAATRAADLGRMEATLVNGDMSLVLHELAKKSPESIPLLADNFLQTMQGLPTDLVGRAAKPVIERILDGLHAESERTGDEELKHAAAYLKWYVCSTAAQRRFNEKYNTFNRELGGETQSRLERFVLDSLSDPDRRLTPFTRKAIVKAALDALARTFDADEQLASELDVLWRQAADGGFMAEHKQPIFNARFSRARQLVPGILKRIVADALGHPVKPATDLHPNDWDLARDLAFVTARKH